MDTKHSPVSEPHVDIHGGITQETQHQEQKEGQKS